MTAVCHRGRGAFSSLNSYRAGKLAQLAQTVWDPVESGAGSVFPETALTFLNETCGEGRRDAAPGVSGEKLQTAELGTARRLRRAEQQRGTSELWSAASL